MTSTQASGEAARTAFNAALEAGDNIATTLGIITVATGENEIVADLPVVPRLTNFRGALQGGVIATMADIIAGRLAMEGLVEGRSSATNDMTIRYLAPIVEGPARATARVLRRTRRMIVIDVEVRDVALDRLAAVASLSFTLLDPLPKGEALVG